MGPALESCQIPNRPRESAIIPFNEDSRVKIPAVLHLTRLGYTYLPLCGARWDDATNIFPEIFHASIARLNPEDSPA